jgi:hypothetical protein
MRQLLNTNEVILKPLIVEDILQVAAIGKTDCAAIPKLKNTVIDIVLVKSSILRRQLLLHWYNHIFLDFGKSTPQNKSTHSRGGQTLLHTLCTHCM